MNATATAAPFRRCEHCHQLTEPDLGFGYSREPDTATAPTPVPAGVDLYFLTGRTPRRAAA